MFSGPKRLVEKYSISEYIENNDIFNSELLVKINSLKPYDDYKISKHEYRIDLIASDIYGESKYSQILLYYNKMQIDDLKRGTIIKYPAKSDIDAMIRSMNPR